MMDINSADLALAEHVVNILFFLESSVRIFVNKFSVKYLLSPFFLIDFVSLLPGICEVLGVTVFVGSTRTLRVVRLLRLISPDDNGR
jgi:hypothetical protein